MPRNYFYLFERKSFYTAKALNMAIPGAMSQKLASEASEMFIDIYEAL